MGVARDARAGTVRRSSARLATCRLLVVLAFVLVSALVYATVSKYAHVDMAARDAALRQRARAQEAAQLVVGRGGSGSGSGSGSGGDGAGERSVPMFAGDAEARFASYLNAPRGATFANVERVRGADVAVDDVVVKGAAGVAAGNGNGKKRQQMTDPVPVPAPLLTVELAPPASTPVPPREEAAKEAASVLSGAATADTGAVTPIEALRRAEQVVPGFTPPTSRPKIVVVRTSGPIIDDISIAYAGQYGDEHFPDRSRACDVEFVQLYQWNGLKVLKQLLDEYFTVDAAAGTVDFHADGVVLKLIETYGRVEEGRTAADYQYFRTVVNAIYNALYAAEHNDVAAFPAVKQIVAAIMKPEQYFANAHSGETLATPVAMRYLELVGGELVTPAVYAGNSHWSCWSPQCDAFPENVGTPLIGVPKRGRRPNLIRYVCSHCVKRYHRENEVDHFHRDDDSIAPRNEYVEALQRHVFVHSFGACLHTAETAVTADGDEISLDDNASLYSFVFEFVGENVCFPGYHTEKLWRAYTYGAIPVVLGSMEGMEHVAPTPDSYIHVDDFPSAKALADHLVAVSKDAELYNSYHKWRRNNFADVDPAWVKRAFYSAGTDGQTFDIAVYNMCDYLYTGRNAEMWVPGRKRTGEFEPKERRQCHFTRIEEGVPAEPRILRLDFEHVRCGDGVDAAIAALLGADAREEWNSAQYIEKRVCVIHNDVRDVANAMGVVVNLRNRHKQCADTVHGVLSALLGDGEDAAVVDGGATFANWYHNVGHVYAYEYGLDEYAEREYSLEGYPYAVPVLFDNSFEDDPTGHGHVHVSDADVKAVLGRDARTVTGGVQYGSGEESSVARRRSWQSESANAMVFTHTEQWREMMRADNVVLRPELTDHHETEGYVEFVPDIANIDAGTAMCRFFWHREDMPTVTAFLDGSLESAELTDEALDSVLARDGDEGGADVVDGGVVDGWKVPTEPPTILIFRNVIALEPDPTEVYAGQYGDAVFPDPSRKCNVEVLKYDWWKDSLKKTRELIETYFSVDADAGTVEFAADAVVLKLIEWYGNVEDPPANVDGTAMFSNYRSVISALYNALYAAEHNDPSAMPAVTRLLQPREYFPKAHANAKLATPVALNYLELMSGLLVSRNLWAGAAHYACWSPECDAFPENVGTMSTNKPMLASRPNLVRYSCSHCIKRYRTQRNEHHWSRDNPSISPRNEYVEALQRHVFVHSSGSCLHTADTALTTDGDEISLDDNRSLKFFVFEFVGENVCFPGYHTEKMLRAYTYGAIPVVFGSMEGLDFVAPSPDSYIHVDDFPSAKALADHLVAVSKDARTHAHKQILRTGQPGHPFASTKSLPPFIRQRAECRTNCGAVHRVQATS